jgi:glycosyltransferase involved in cell wall biosynthesis
MHILLIHQAFAALDEPGGTRHHELARFLAAQGHRVTVIASPVSYLTGSATPGHTLEQSEPGITILRTYTYPAWHRSFIHRVISFLSFMLSSFFTGLRVREVDLVWGTSPPIFQAGTAWAIARLKNVPFVFEVRDLWPAFAVGVGVLHNRLLIRAAEAFEHFLYRHADRVVINSPGFRDHVQRGGARRIELVPNGADTRMFDPQSTGAEFRQQHGLEHKLIALYAGAHGMSNDLDVLLQAADRLRDRREIVLVLLGDGKEKPTLMETARQMQLENVTFLAPVPKVSMPAALAAADICIAILKPIPEYKTVYPNKVFDYLAASRPVVLAIAGVIEQVVQDAKAGICVPPGDPQAIADALRWLADNPVERQAMGRRGRAYIHEHFDRQVVALRLERILCDTAGIPSGTPPET